MKELLCGLASAALPLAAGTQAHAQEAKAPYRSVAYDDPYFTKAPAPAPTPTFTRAAAASQTPSRVQAIRSPQRPAPVAPVRAMTRAAPSLPTQTPRAAPRPAPRPPLRATASQGTNAATVTPASQAGRVMRGRIEATTGLSLVRGPYEDEAVSVGGVIGADRVVAHLGGGAVFLGAYGAVSFPRTEASDTTTVSDGTTTTERTVTLSEGREVDLGVRLGWATDRVALYGSAGLLNARRDTEARTVVSSAAGTPTQATETLKTYRDGWRAGFGTELSLPADLYLRAGYDYADLGDEETRHHVTTGLGLRF